MSYESKPIALTTDKVGTMKRLITPAFVIWTFAGCVAVIVAAFTIGLHSPAWLGELVWVGYSVGVFVLGYAAIGGHHDQ